MKIFPGPLFADAAARCSGRPALSDSMTFADLDTRANAVVCAPTALELAADDRIGVSFNRAELVGSSLGLKRPGLGRVVLNGHPVNPEALR